MKNGKPNEILFSGQPLTWFTMNLYSAWFMPTLCYCFSAKYKQLTNDLCLCKHRGKKIIIFARACFPSSMLRPQKMKTNLVTSVSTVNQHFLIRNTENNPKWTYPSPLSSTRVYARPDSSWSLETLWKVFYIGSTHHTFTLLKAEMLKLQALQLHTKKKC